MRIAAIPQIRRVSRAGQCSLAVISAARMLALWSCSGILRFRLAGVRGRKLRRVQWTGLEVLRLGVEL